MAAPISVAVEFGCGIQGLGALREAAYRLIGTASCRIDEAGDHYVCHLSADAGAASVVDAEALRRRFLDLVTDENLREKVTAETQGVRNVILALAFGALASSSPGKTIA